MAKSRIALESYKDHRAGSRKGLVHKTYDQQGSKKAEAKARKLGLAKGTPKKWIGTWEKQFTLTAKGQVTIPKNIREYLRLHPGDEVKFFIHPDGRVVILPVRPVSELRGMLKASRRASTEDMNLAVAKAAAERHRRSIGR